MLFKSRQGTPAWIVAFLGNPGPKYDSTRHNAGFMAADAFGKAHQVKIDRLKFKALTALCTLSNSNILLMKPQTYMNLSGESVQAALSFYKVPIERVIVVADDVALPPGRIRIKRSGSDGGHKGLKNIIERCGSADFPRVKIGVGAPPHPEQDVVSWVIGSLKNQDYETIKEAAAQAASAVQEIILSGIDFAMNKFN